LVLCTYHKQDDAAVLGKMLRSLGFQTEFSKRYMMFSWEKFSPSSILSEGGGKEIATAYLRRGLIRAHKAGTLSEPKC
jgi:hypothetical protein